jgi:hypothetical protein
MSPIYLQQPLRRSAQRLYIALGGAPPDEAPADPLGRAYRDRALRECYCYVRQIRMTLGIEHPDCRLQIITTHHDDQPPTLIVVCFYNPRSHGALQYALDCAAFGPLTWDALSIATLDGTTAPPDEPYDHH